jgi:hypothetical protein
MIEIQINLVVNPNKMEQVYDLLYEDEKNALNGIFHEFTISKNKNKIDIKAVCDTMDALSKHMMNTHYRWKDLKTSGAIISQTHHFLEL